MRPQVLVLAPLRIEQCSVRSGGVPVRRTGMGARRSRRHGASLPKGVPVAVAGFGGALGDGPRGGEVVVGTEVRDDSGARTELTEPGLLARLLCDAGLTVHTGPVVTTDRLVHGARRGELAATGALVADLESAHLLHAVTAPRAVIRVVVDTPRFPLSHPRTVCSGIAAIRSLRSTGSALREWAEKTAQNIPAADLEG